MSARDVQEHLARIVGTEAEMAPHPGPGLLVSPRTESACAAILKTASSQGWKVRVTGGTATATEAIPADIVLATRHMNTISDIQPADLFATVAAGVTTDVLHQQLAQSGMWFAADAPNENQTIGAVAATGESGSLQTGYGPLRDQILGLTVVTPAGRVIVGGGRVVKNVAGYDIPKMVIGSFGAFGVITKLHLRLRVAPESDVTWTARGTFKQMMTLKQHIETSTVTTAAVEMHCLSDGPWTLAVRLLGSEDAVQRRGAALNNLPGAQWQSLEGRAAASYWKDGRVKRANFPVSVRLGASASTIEDTVATLHKELHGGITTVYANRNLARWCGNADDVSIVRLRATVAKQRVPLTVERGPWPTLVSTGHFGAMQPGVATIMAGLRTVFDPASTMVVPLESTATQDRG